MVALGHPVDPEELAPGVHRLGSWYIGWYLLEDKGGLTLVDAAVPGYWDQLVRFLQSRGAGLSDVEAVVLTHHHDDHRGNAERLRSEYEARVLVHEDDLESAMARNVPPPVPIWRPAVFRYFVHLLRNGVLKTPPVLEASQFVNGEVLDVPGRPRVIHAPGHTAGNCALLLESARVLLSGDTLVNANLFTGAEGPRIAPPFTNEDSEVALESLSLLEPVDADLLLPGHGDPWRGPISEAVRQARQIGIY